MSAFPESFEGLPDISRRRALSAMAVMLGLTFAFGIFGLDRSPTVWYDETFTNDSAYQLATHGKLIIALEPGVAQFDQKYLGPPVYPLFQSVNCNFNCVERRMTLSHHLDNQITADGFDYAFSESR